MGADANMVMKKLLQKVVDNLLSQKKYQGLQSATIFFVFGSQHKTAMCQFVYGLKIKTQLPYTKRSDLVRELQVDIKRISDKRIQTSVCATDVMIED